VVKVQVGFGDVETEGEEKKREDSLMSRSVGVCHTVSHSEIEGRKEEGRKEGEVDMSRATYGRAAMTVK
jgi:hypothetical protein